MWIVGKLVVTQSTADVIVVGAGAFGAWTALSLIERGMRVVLVDVYGVGNAKASSGGESRNIRAAYGDRELYTRWSIEAWRRWQAREIEVGQRLLYPCGSLRMLDSVEVAPQCAIFDRFGHPYEMIDGDEAARRWPQIEFGCDHILYEPQSGILAARDGLSAVVRLFVTKGGRMIHGRVPPLSGLTVDAIAIDDEQISAGQFVFACGPWLPKLFPALLDGWIKTPRRELFFVGAAPGDVRFDWRHCPNLTDPLGWTSSDIGGGFKIAPIIRHVPFDPDDGDRMPTPALLDQIHAYVAARLPGLVGRPVIGSYVSQLENTDNEHFLIDRHPDWRNVVIAGGGSGHAFKMGPVIGDHVADLVIRGVHDPELVALFGVAAHGPVAADQGG